MKYVFILLFVCFSNLSWAQNRVDVLVLYPDTVANVFNTNADVQVANLISQGNSAFAKSSIDIELNLLEAVQISGYSNTSCGQSVVNSLETNTEVTDLRRLYKPHVTILLCDSPTNNIAGTANFPSTPGSSGAPKALAVALYTHSFHFVHELGHILGVGHGKISGSTTHYGVPISSSMGYGVADSYRDVMTFPNAFGNAVQHLFFSNPAIQTCIGQTNTTCGTNQHNAAGGIPTVYRDYVSRYPDHWSSTQPTFHTRFLFNFDSTFVSNDFVEMYAPYYKEMCVAEPGQSVLCSYTTVTPGTYRFRGSNNVVWNPSVCDSIDGSNYCTINLDSNDNGRSIHMAIKQKTILTKLNLTTSSSGYGRVDVYDGSRKICTLGAQPTLSCSLDYNTPAAITTKLTLKLISGFSGASFGWSGGCETITNDQCEIILNGGTRNISAWVDYD